MYSMYRVVVRCTEHIEVNLMVDHTSLSYDNNLLGE